MLATTPPQPRSATFKPYGSHRELFTSRAPELLGAGPAGTGKTFTIAWRIHIMCLRYAGSRHLMTRKDLESLKPAALTTFVNGVQPHLFGVETFGGNKFTPAEFRYPNGSVIQVTGLDRAEKVKSAEYDTIYVNEATEIPESTAEMLTSRLRNGVMPYQQLIMDCNPAGPRHWLRQRGHAGKTKIVESTHRDNPAYWNERTSEWTEQGQQYVNNVLANLSGVNRERLFLGKWAAAEGLVYPEFSPDVHEQVVDTDGWRCVLGVDVGTQNPTSILVAFVAGDGRIHIADELYRRGLGTKGILDAIKGYTDEYSPDAVYVDPSAKAYITDLHAMGIPAIGANNDVLTGIQRVRSVFQTGFTIDPKCTNTIDEFGMYAYSSTAKTETDKPAKEHDHCLAAGTIVETERGGVVIEDVLVGDRVLTRQGYRRVTASGISALNAEVMTVHLSNGTTLTGTPNHRVWDSGRNQWVHMDSLRYGDILMETKERLPCELKPSFTKASSSGDIRIRRTNPTEAITALIRAISDRVSSRFIERFGATTMAISRMAGMCTTLTATRPTTTSATWSACLGSITLATTARSQHQPGSVSTWKRYEHWHLNGTDRLKGLSGIESMAARHGQHECPSERSATSAASPSTTLQGDHRLDSAPTTAGQHGGGRQAWMTKTVFAKRAARHSESTSTARPERAPVHVVGFSRAEPRQNVYDLTVESAHEFFANGVLVHNSMDSLRYLCMGAAEPVINLLDFYS